MLPSITRWSGNVSLRGDVVVPWGGLLEIAAATRVHPAENAGWKYDFHRPGDRGQRLGPAEGVCALVVLGTVRILGNDGKPVRFVPEGAWGGLVLLGKARAFVEHADFTRAEAAGIACFDRSRLEVTHTRISQCRNGILAAGVSRVSFDECEISKNRCGLLAYDLALVQGKSSRFLQNAIGLRADDGSVVRLEKMSFRANREAGMLAQGRAALWAAGNGFEGHENAAVFLQEKSSAHFRDNRLFHNVRGYQIRDRARLLSEEDKIGPNEVCGVQAQVNSEVVIRRGFVHSHSREAAVQTQNSAKVVVWQSKFFGNVVAGAARDESRWNVDRGEFQTNRDAALQMDGASRLRVRHSRFSGNGSGVAFFEKSEGFVERNEFRAQGTNALDVRGRSRLRLTENVLQENAVALEAHDSAVVEASLNDVARQGVHGFLIRRSARLLAAGCRFRENAQAGIQGLENARLALTKNRFMGNAVGVGLKDGASAVVEENVFQGQTREGASCSSVGKVVFENNVFAGNEVGVGHFDRDQSFVAKNRFWENARAAGVFAGTASPVWEGNRCADNFRGVECRDEATPRVRRNCFEKSRDVGLLCEGRASPRVERNRFLRNKIGWTCASSARPVMANNRFEDNLVDTIDRTETKNS